MEAAKVPHLRVVDAHGEVQDVCEHCVAKDQAIERLTRSYEGTIRSLRDQLDERKDGQKALDPVVLHVTEDWCSRAHASGWWTLRPKPTPPRLEAVSAAFNKGFEPNYLVLVHIGGFMSAMSQRTNRSFQRAWLEPATLYGKFVDSHHETALDPNNDRVRHALTAPQPLIERWQLIVDLADPCDHCGHLRLDHDKPSIANDFSDAGACLVHGCADCPGFDDFDLKSQRWLEARAPKPRFRS